MLKFFHNLDMSILHAFLVDFFHFLQEEKICGAWDGYHCTQEVMVNLHAKFQKIPRSRFLEMLMFRAKYEFFIEFWGFFISFYMKELFLGPGNGTVRRPNLCRTRMQKIRGSYGAVFEKC